MTNVNLNRRPATRADIPAMSAIRIAVQENRLNNPARVTTQMYEDYLHKLGRGWVAELEGEIIAFSYAAAADASIWALFTQPGREGLGAGKQLLRLAADWLFGLGFERVLLGTEANTRADRFYAAQGWARGAMRPGSVEVDFTLSNPGPLRIAPLAPAEAQALLTASDAYMRVRYPALDEAHLETAEALGRPGVSLLGAWWQGQLVACGAAKRVQDDAAAEPYGEIKRVFVAEAWRGRGISKALMQRLELLLQAQGLTLARLETGIHQPEAQALYRGMGYRPCGPFGSHVADATGVFMEKLL
ncbi:GNAT family N-acetyltransferase [Paucibacter soli]|uniref:GNAT family N-acetyltransferase n=1 Tax=Paucibacter soli TaxID=3133433 RepID=UPI0030A584AB